MLKIAIRSEPLARQSALHLAGFVFPDDLNFGLYRSTMEQARPEHACSLLL